MFRSKLNVFNLMQVKIKMFYDNFGCKFKIFMSKSVSGICLIRITKHFAI